MPISEVELLEFFAATIADHAERLEGRGADGDTAQGGSRDTYFCPPGNGCDDGKGVRTLPDLLGPDSELLSALARSWQRAAESGGDDGAPMSDVARRIAAFLTDHGTALSEEDAERRRVGEFVYPVV